MQRTDITATFLAILTLIAVGAVLKMAQVVVLPLVIAWLLSFIFGPTVQLLNRHRVPTALSTLLILVVLISLCYFGGIFLKARVDAFVSAYTLRYEARFAFMLSDMASRWEWSMDPFAGVNWGSQVRTWLLKATGPVISFITSLLMVMIFLVFLLLGKPYFQYKLRKAMTPEMADRVDSVLRGIGSGISRYLYLQFLISSITGLLVWFALTLLKVDFAITWGALAFFLNFIPTLGSIMASIPPILLAMVQFYPHMLPAVLVAIVVASIQFIIGNGIAPKILGDTLNLSPVVILLSLIFWGWLWGPVGAILSVPIAAAMKICCEHVEPLKPIGIMMGSGKRYKREFDAESAPESAAGSAASSSASSSV